jgi:hypothetical protein
MEDDIVLSESDGEKIFQHDDTNARDGFENVEQSADAKKLKKRNNRKRANKDGAKGGGKKPKMEDADVKSLGRSK